MEKGEKMKKRIFLSMILAAVMLAALLAGCGSGGSAAQKEEPAAAESTQKEAAPAETKEEDAAPETESTEAMTASADEAESTEAVTTSADETESTEAATASADEKENTEAATTSADEKESTSSALRDAAEENTGVGNPWSDVESAEEAAKGAGIDSFVIADDPGLDLGQLFEKTYRCMHGIAEARLEYPASALTVRKGTYAEEGDISGDYTEYANTWTQDVNGIEVTCFGNREGDAAKSIWTVDNMYFSIVAEGLGGDEDFGLNAERLTAMVNSIQ